VVPITGEYADKFSRSEFGANLPFQFDERAAASIIAAIT
jgi:hypothetical protein